MRMSLRNLIQALPESLTKFQQTRPGRRSHDEAHRFWQAAYDASQQIPRIPITVPWVTALEWTTSGESFSVKTDLSDLLSEYGDGVYTVMVWGNIGRERVVISEYSIFY